MTSPMHRHARSVSAAAGSTSGKKLQPHAKAAAQRLAHVMASKSGGGGDDSDEEDDFVLESAPSLGIGGRGRAARPSSPMAMPLRMPSLSGTRASLPAKNADSQSPRAHSLVGNREQPPFNFSERPSSLADIRASQRLNDAEEQPSVGSPTPKSLNYFEKQASPIASSHIQSFNAEQQPSSVRLNSLGKSSQPHPIEQPQSTRSSIYSRTPQSPKSADQVQAPLARSGSGMRSPRSISYLDQPSSALRSLGVKTIQMVPQSVPLKLRQTLSGVPVESPRKEKKLSLDLGSIKIRDPSNQDSASALEDEVDLLQDANETLLEKLRRAEARFRESEMRTRVLEKQVSSLGEGVSMETRLLSRKEADLIEREAALKAVEQTFGGKGEEIVLLRMEAESARDEVTSALKQLQNATRDLTSFQIMTKRMILSPEEMEEVIMKRCWLAQHWSLCVHHGVHSDIASARYDYWSSFVRRPWEVVLAAGGKAKAVTPPGKNDRHKKGNIEDMLMVERGLRELTLLKVESALAVAMAHKRRHRSLKSGATDELKLPVDCQFSTESFDLSKEESDDVRFKQAWLIYFWRRAANHGLEPEIAEERLQFWISQSTTQPVTSHEAVHVDRGLLELRKLEIEAHLWKESRKSVED